MTEVELFAMSDGCGAPAPAESVVQGEKYRFTVLTPRLIRLEWNDGGEFVDRKTQLVVSRDFPTPTYAVEEAPEGGLVIETEYLRLTYRGGPFSAKSLSIKLTRGAPDHHRATWRFGADREETGNLLGTARTLDGADGPVELEEGVLSELGYAAIEDSDSVVLADDGWIAPRSTSLRLDDIDTYFFGYGSDYGAALRDYHHLTGATPLVPRFALGNWWSRYWPYTEDQYLALMQRFEDETIPLSVAVIDMDWHLVDIDPALGTGWTGYTWNRELIPDPERFLGRLHDRGLATTLNLHPADGVRRHEEAYPEMAKALGLDPASGDAIEFDVTSREFVTAYLEHLHHPLEQQGVDFWWMDWQQGVETKVPGLDPLWMLNHIHYLDSGREGRRPLTFSRYAGLGSHRYPLGFSGDTVITWDSLNFQPYFTATAANAGYTWWSHDIGGHYSGYKDPEMMVRWVEFGVFSPINRLHSSNSPFTSKEPWCYGRDAEAIIGSFMRLRHRLIPYLYTAAWKAHLEAVAVVRPMYHDWPTEEGAKHVPNEYLFGEGLICVPVTAPMGRKSRLSKVKAWLPEGTWFDIFTGQRYQGGKDISLHRGLGTIPVLARAGTILPLADPLTPVSDAPAALTLRLFPGDGSFDLIEDKGAAEVSAEDRNVTRITQVWSQSEDGTLSVEVCVLPTTGPAPQPEREVMIDLVGVRGVSDEVGELIQDELLAPALRIDLGEVDMTQGAQIRVDGLVEEGVNVLGLVFELLDSAEIGYQAKELAMAAVKELSGTALAAQLLELDLPEELYGAVLECENS